MKQIHNLKCIDPWFEFTWRRQKVFEIRKNDRDFHVGDVVTLHEYNPMDGTFTKRRISGEIQFIFPENEIYLLPGYVVFQLFWLVNFEGDKKIAGTSKKYQ